MDKLENIRKQLKGNTQHITTLNTNIKQYYVFIRDLYIR